MTKIRFELSRKPSKQKKSGFVPVTARWVIERSHAWMERCKSLVKNFERTLTHAVTKINLCFTRLMLQRLASPPWNLKWVLYRGSVSCATHVLDSVKVTLCLRHGQAYCQDRLPFDIKLSAAQFGFPSPNRTWSCLLNDLAQAWWSTCHKWYTKGVSVKGKLRSAPYVMTVGLV